MHLARIYGSALEDFMSDRVTPRRVCTAAHGKSPSVVNSPIFAKRVLPNCSYRRMYVCMYVRCSYLGGGLVSFGTGSVDFDIF